MTLMSGQRLDKTGRSCMSMRRDRKRGRERQGGKQGRLLRFMKMNDAEEDGEDGGQNGE